MPMDAAGSVFKSYALYVLVSNTTWTTAGAMSERSVSNRPFSHMADCAQLSYHSCTFVDLCYCAVFLPGLALLCR